MQANIAIFLVIAVAIIALAGVLTRLFKNSIARDKRLDDANVEPRSGDAIATWSGIHHSDGSDD